MRRSPARRRDHGCAHSQSHTPHAHTPHSPQSDSAQPAIETRSLSSGMVQRSKQLVEHEQHHAKTMHDPAAAIEAAATLQPRTVTVQVGPPQAKKFFTDLCRCQNPAKFARSRRDRAAQRRR